MYKNPIKISVVLGVALLVLPKSGTALADPESGRLLFKDKHCILCHNIELPGTEFKPVCPGLRDIKDLHDREWLAKWLADPAGVWKTDDADVRDINRRFYAYRGIKPRSRKSFMATMIGKTIHLSPAEIKHLIDYLMTL